MLPLSAIKCLPESCRNLPFQAVKASLYGELPTFPHLTLIGPYLCAPKD